MVHRSSQSWLKQVATLGGRAAFAVAQSGHSAGTARAEVPLRWSSGMAGGLNYIAWWM